MLPLEMKERKTQRELFIVIDEMTNIPEHFGKKLEQQKDNSNRIRQLAACLMTTFNEFEQYIHQAILPYTKKEETGMLKNKTEMLKEENSRLRHDMSKKEILIKSLTETLNRERAKQMWQTET